jgi:hypothetical protein
VPAKSKGFSALKLASKLNQIAKHESRRRACMGH